MTATVPTSLAPASPSPTAVDARATLSRGSKRFATEIDGAVDALLGSTAAVTPPPVGGLGLASLGAQQEMGSHRCTTSLGASFVPEAVPSSQHPAHVDPQPASAMPTSATHNLHNGDESAPDAGATSRASTATADVVLQNVTGRDGIVAGAAHEHEPAPPLPLAARAVTLPGMHAVTDLGRPLSTAIETGLRCARLRLDPPDLGVIEVDIRVDEGGVHLRFRADAAVAASRIHEHLGRIEMQLAEHGLKLASFDVDGSGAGTQQRQDTDPREPAPSQGPPAAPGQRAPEEQPPPRRVRHLGVDLVA